MTKAIDHSSMDASLNDIAGKGNRLHLVSQAPASYADVATYSLGFVALNLGAGNGAYILQNGAVSGRRLTLAQQTVPGTAPGTATHAVIVDTAAGTIKQVTTAPNYNMANGVNQTVPSYDVWEIQDPT
jgi:hypothetical protein